LEPLLAEQPRAHTLGEVARELEVDVGLEQRLAHAPQTFVDVLGRQLLLAAQEGEGLGQALGEGLEHGRRVGEVTGSRPLYQTTLARRLGPSRGHAPLRSTIRLPRRA